MPSSCEGLVVSNRAASVSKRLEVDLWKDKGRVGSRCQACQLSGKDGERTRRDAP